MNEQSTPAAVRNSNHLRAAKARRRLIRNVVIVGVVIIAGVVVWRSRSAKPVVSTLVTQKVERRDITQVISASGAVTAQTGALVEIGSQITGVIKRLYADVGSSVKAGQVIAELSLPELESQVKQAQATLALNRAKLAEQLAGVAQQDTTVSTEIARTQAAVAVAQVSLREVEQSATAKRKTAQAQVQQAEANHTNSAASLARTQQLFAKGYVAASEVDSAKAAAAVDAATLVSARQNLQLVQTTIAADLDNARESVRQAQAYYNAARANSADTRIKRLQVTQARHTVEQSVAALAIAKADLDKAFIRSPISGTVIQLSQQQGETIAAGLSAPTVIIVADLNRLQVDAYVDETDIGRIKLGQRAEITVDSYPNHPFSGRVTKIASGSTIQENVVTYDVTIALDNPGHLLKPDMTTTVNITVARHPQVLAVSVDAVKIGTAGSTVTIEERRRDGAATYRTAPVTTGVNDGEYTEILKGLQAGQTVVVSGKVPGTVTTQAGPRGGLFGPGSGGARRSGSGSR